MAWVQRGRSSLKRNSEVLMAGPKRSTDAADADDDDDGDDDDEDEDEDDEEDEVPEVPGDNQGPFFQECSQYSKTPCDTSQKPKPPG